MAGEVTQLGFAGHPTGYFEIPDKTGGPVDVVAVDTLLAILTETPNGVEVESVDFPTLVYGESGSLIQVLPFSFDTLTPILADAGPPPVIVGMLPIARTDVLAPVYADTGTVVEIGLMVSGSDTLTPVLADVSQTPLDLEPQLKSASETLTPVLQDTFISIVQGSPSFEFRSSSDDLSFSFVDSGLLVADIDEIKITGNPAGFIELTLR